MPFKEKKVLRYGNSADGNCSSFTSSALGVEPSNAVLLSYIPSPFQTVFVLFRDNVLKLAGPALNLCSSHLSLSRSWTVGLHPHTRWYLPF